MIRVVIDTNVLVSALISRHGPNARVLDLILADKIRPCVSEAVLNEYGGVLGRPKFYECAEAAEAHYIVTGNRKHFATPYRSIKIASARELLEILAKTNEPG